MSCAQFVIPLATATDVSLVGGKAANLARLMAAGLTVPDGFVVTTDAYRCAGDAVAIPPEVVGQIQAAYEKMGSPLVAARSSATAEDMADASMAGQYDTFLNLSGLDALLEGIARCWRSLASERLQTYLRQQAIAPESVAMAVVVQRLIPAEVAGVLFTADPRTGSTEEMLIEAAWGLGEGVVSGNVQPDRICLQAADGSVVHYHVAEKHSRLCPGQHAFEEVPVEDRSRACLKYESLYRLWQIGRRAARHFDGPQDIEWALVDGDIHVLQSRPITTLREAALRHKLPNTIRRQLQLEIAAGQGPWVRHNLDETLAHPTPLTWSIIKPFMSGNGGFGSMYKQVGFQPSSKVCEDGFLTLIGGRIYMDCQRMPEMFAANYPFKYDLDLLRMNPDAAQQSPSVPQGSLSAQAEAVKLSRHVTRRLRQQASDLDHRFDTQFIAELQAWCGQQQGLDLTQLTNMELIGRWQSQCAKVLDEFAIMAFLPSMIEALATADLRDFLQEHVWDEAPDALMQRLVMSPIPDQTFLSNMRLQEVGAGKRSRQAWLTEFGARGPGEFDLASPRWNERPGDLDALANRLADESPLLEHHQRRLGEAASCLDQLRRSLSSKLYQDLEQRVELAARYVRFREDGKHYLMMAYAVLRQTAQEFARRLEIGEDIFMLHSHEMLEALRIGFVPQDRIHHRRMLRGAEASCSLPRVIGESELPNLGVPSTDAKASRWAAHVLSPGTCSGVVRIVHSPESAGELGKNYLLVCPSTDPAWTPLFVGAAGLILERGGTLSHGAIVARELGLPAVVLEDATQLFQEGELLTLDAHLGQVVRGESSDAAVAGPAAGAEIESSLRPPPVGRRERVAAQWGLLVAALWGALLLAMWLLPVHMLRDPLFAGLDWLLWPLVPRLGMPGTVAAIAAVFAILPLIIQKLFVDNERLLTARKRAARGRKIARTLPADDVRRQRLLSLAAPVTTRVLKGSMTALAFLLGPMILIFLWLPARLDPASWNGAPGQTVTVLAEVRGDWPHPLRLSTPAPLELDPLLPSQQTVQPIRSTLQALRQEWSQPSNMTHYPWELQAAADQINSALLASLDRFLATEMPTQKVSWRVIVPPQAAGHHLIRLETEAAEPLEIKLAFGNHHPPAVSEMTSEHGPVHSLKAVYPRPLQKNTFWTPLKNSAGLDWDFGWLGVYLLAYVPIMIVCKKILRVA